MYVRGGFFLHQKEKDFQRIEQLKDGRGVHSGNSECFVGVFFEIIFSFFFDKLLE